jgi:hypothetical protein
MTGQLSHAFFMQPKNALFAMCNKKEAVHGKIVAYWIGIAGRLRQGLYLVHLVVEVLCGAIGARNYLVL